MVAARASREEVVGERHREGVLGRLHHGKAGRGRRDGRQQIVRLAVEGQRGCRRRLDGRDQEPFFAAQIALRLGDLEAVALDRRVGTPNDRVVEIVGIIVHKDRHGLDESRQVGRVAERQRVFSRGPDLGDGAALFDRALRGVRAAEPPREGVDTLVEREVTCGVLRVAERRGGVGAAFVIRRAGHHPHFELRTEVFGDGLVENSLDDAVLQGALHLDRSRLPGRDRKGFLSLVEASGERSRHLLSCFDRDAVRAGQQFEPLRNIGLRGVFADRFPVAVADADGQVLHRVVLRGGGDFRTGRDLHRQRTRRRCVVERRRGLRATRRGEPQHRDQVSVQTFHGYSSVGLTRVSVAEVSPPALSITRRWK